MKKSVVLLIIVMIITGIVFSAIAFAGQVTLTRWSEPKVWEYCGEATERMPWITGEILYFALDYDIYYSKYDGTLGTWSEPQPVPGPINTGVNEINPAVVRNGKVLYFARYDPITDYDFYRSEWTEEKSEWGEPVLIEEISSDAQEWDIWVSEDETTLYLTSKSQFGTRDIWKSTWNGTKWTTPVNLGIPINSEGNEWSIFIGPNGEIYFDSDRSGGQGSSDIWMAANETSEPVNLGVFNSPVADRSMAFNDKFFFFSASKREGGAGGYDIWYCLKE